MVEVDEWCVVAVVDVRWKLFNVFEVEVLLYVKKFEVFLGDFSKKFFKNFQSSEEMLSLRGVVNDLGAYSNLFCLVSALFGFVFGSGFSLSDFDQDLTPAFCATRSFCLRENCST